MKAPEKTKIAGPCPEGCENTDKPYCHCVDCGETGVALSEDGICEKCQNPPLKCRYCRTGEGSCCECI